MNLMGQLSRPFGTLLLTVLLASAVGCGDESKKPKGSGKAVDPEQAEKKMDDASKKNK